NTDDMDGTVAKLTANGARVLDQMVSGNGRRICFLEGPDGVQVEIIEMQRSRRRFASPVRTAHISSTATDKIEEPTGSPLWRRLHLRHSLVAAHACFIGV